MINKKKQINLLKIQNFFVEYPIILLLQHNNLKVSDWSHLRVNIKQMQNADLLIVKNSVIEKAILPFFNEKNIENLFQGPSFFIGCQNMSQLKHIWNFSKSMPNVIFVGGIMTKQFLNHLDIEKLLQLNDSIYVTLVEVLNTKNNVYNLLQKSLDFNYFSHIQESFVSCLNEISIKK